MPPFGAPTRTSKISSSAVAASFNAAVEGKEGAEDTPPLLPVEDFDESTWSYCKYSKLPETRLDVVADRLNTFKRESSWKRKMVRLFSKMGVATVSLFEDDDQPVPTHAYDLSRVVNVRWVFVPQSECLSFSSEGDNVHDQFVYGQIAFRVDLVPAQYEQLYSELVNSGLAGVTRNAAEGGGGSGGGLDAGSSSLDSPRHQQPTVPDIVNNPRFPKEHLTTLTFAFFSNKEATSWYEWFASLITVKERMHVEMSEYDLNLPLPSIPVFRLTPQNTKFLKEFIRGFHKAPRSRTGLGGGLFSGGDGPPADGKVRVKPPGSQEFSPLYMSAATSTGELYFSSKKPNALLNSSHIKYEKRLKLIEQCLIQATTAFGAEFVIDLNPQLVSGGGGVGGGSSTVVGYGGGVGVGGAKHLEHSQSTWWFLCKTVHMRNEFIEWLRMVKGRGEKAQTEEETYPFMASAAAALGDTGDDDITGGHGGGNAFEAAHVRLSTKTAMLSSAPGREEDADGGGMGVADNMWKQASATDASPPRRRVGFGEVVASEVDDERKKREVEEYLALYPSREPSSASSTDSVTSIRRFQYFPTYNAVTVLAYVDSCVSVHMDGRPIKTLQKVMGHAWVNRQGTSLSASGSGAGSSPAGGARGRGAVRSTGGGGNLMAVIAANRMRQRAVSSGGRGGDNGGEFSEGAWKRPAPRPTSMGPRHLKTTPQSSRPTTRSSKPIQTASAAKRSIYGSHHLETGLDPRGAGSEAIEVSTGITHAGHFSNVFASNYGTRVRRREAAAESAADYHHSESRRSNFYD